MHLKAVTNLKNGLYSPDCIPKVLGTAFFIEKTLMAAFEVSFSIRKEFKKRKLMERLPLL